MNSIIEEDSESNKSDINSIGTPNIKRRTHKFQTQKMDKNNLKSLYNKVGKITQRKSIAIPQRMKTLSNINSSKALGTYKHKSHSKTPEKIITDIIDNSYNFAMNYHLKETALKIFQKGIDNDETKIKFFCNYLNQLTPFNKIFLKLSKSDNAADTVKLEKILYNLTKKLKYEFCEKNKIVYLHGDSPDKFYIILKGEVDTIIPNEIEVMMNEYEYYYYILRLYKYQEYYLLNKVLNKNYDLYPLDKKLLEDWIQTAYNTLLNLEQESEINKISRKKKANKTYTLAYSNTAELIKHLEKQKKLNLLMLSQNVILLLEKIRIRNEKARDAKKKKALNKKKKESKKKKNKTKTEENLKPNIGYVKLNGEMKKIFMNEDQIEVVEKCANEISQLIELKNDDFDFQGYIKQLNRCEAEKYINRVKPCFFDEDTNEMLSPEQFIVSKSQKNENLNKKDEETDENDIFFKLRNLFGYKKTVDNKRTKLFINRKKTIVYNYVLVNTSSTGDVFGEIIYESNKREEGSPRISTIITHENCQFATLKRSLYNKILKEMNENNLHQRFLFLYSLDLFKDCNKNTFMKNIAFFIKRTFRANEILFNQDDNLGEDRSIYFVESGSFTSFCNISINEIEALFNNLNYTGIIPPDDAHEDNLFNKENHYFCQFKKKKIFLNLFNFSKKDIIGFNDALYDQKYIYTVKCQSSTAVVYEIKLKFFNLIVNSEAKLFEIVERYEAIQRNIMMKFFLNAFNNKTNFYKFISFDNLESEKEEKKVVHKNYFGKNPFVEEKDLTTINNKTNFKAVKTMNKVNDNFIELSLMPEELSTEPKKSEIIKNSLRLNIKRLTSHNYSPNKTQIFQRNKSNTKLSILSSNKSIKKLITSSKKLQNLLRLSSDKIKKNLTKKIKINIDDSNTYKSDKKNNILPIIVNTLPRNNSKEITTKSERILTLYDEKKKNNNKVENYFNNTKTMNKYNSTEKNENNEYSRLSSNLSESGFKVRVMKSKYKTLRGLKKCIDINNINIELKNEDLIDKKEELQLKCYLKDIPNFFKNDKNSKKIFFGMNSKKLYKNNLLFTEFK